MTPGPILTPNSDDLRKQFPISGDQWDQYFPLGRIGATEDFTEVVALLASEHGKFLTGVNYRVDGGMTAR